MITATLFLSACDHGPTEVADVAQLQIIEVAAGSGATATNGRLVTIHYTGWLYGTTAVDHKGEKFDSFPPHQARKL